MFRQLDNECLLLSSTNAINMVLLCGDEAEGKKRRERMVVQTYILYLVPVSNWLQDSNKRERDLLK